MAIPDKKLWKGMFPGNYAGNLWASWNMDLEKSPGRLVLADKFRRFNTGLGVVQKFLRTNATTTDEWWGLVNKTKMLRNGGTNVASGWQADDTTNFAGVDTPLDMEIHESANGEQRLFVSMDDDIAVLNTTNAVNVWETDWGSNRPSPIIPTVSPVLTYRPMAKLQRLLAIANKVDGIPKIDTIDFNDVATLGALTFAAEFTVRVIYSNSNRFWIGLQHDTDGDAKIIEWDGVSSTYNNEYSLDGSFPLCGFIVNDIPYFITEKGYIFKWSGGGFVKVQSFNLDEDRTRLLTSVTSKDTIQAYGAYVERDIVYLNIGIPMSNSASATTLNGGTRRARSGLWIFNTTNNNLYHTMGIGQHASGGTDIDYGHGQLKQIGAVTQASTGNSKKLIVSADVYTGGATWVTGSANGMYIQTNNTNLSSNAGRNRGYVITSYISLKEVEAMWQAMWVKFKKFFADVGGSTSSNRIIVKWRVRDPLKEADAQDPNTNNLELMNAQGDWQNTTSFKCKVPKGVVVGNEVEILAGDNAGCSFNISALSATPDNSTEITVTIDEAAPTSSTDTFLCRFDNWNSEVAISAIDIDNQRIPFTKIGHGQFIQLKIELRGMEVELDEMLPVIKSLTKSKQG